MTNQYDRLNKHFDDFANEIMAQFKHMVKSGNPLVRVSPQVSLFTTYLEISNLMTIQSSVNVVISMVLTTTTSFDVSVI